MGQLISANDCSCGWLHAARFLILQGGEHFNLIVEIYNPTVEHDEIRNMLNEFLEAKGKKPIDEVANTIFPESLYFPSVGREYLYSLYEVALPLIKLFPANRSGTYFERMILWGGRSQSTNQLESVISKLHEAKLWERPYRSRYEVGIYNPDIDGRNLMGFPCLSHLSFKLYNDRLHLTALYRNQFYIERAYGNFIGLGRLLDFIARESQVGLGRLTCLATHAELENVPGGRRAIESLIDPCLKVSEICTSQSCEEL